MALAAVRFADPEDSPPGSGSSSPHNQPLDISREERRFLITTGEPQRQALLDAGIPKLRTYRVQTLYMDTPSLSWSRGQSQIKFRLRQYDNTGPWWFEMKTNTSGTVDKHRRQVTEAQVDSLKLKPVVMVSYYREEFESGSDALEEYQAGHQQALQNWLRVTIDHNVTAILVPTEQPPSVAMRSPIRSLVTMSTRVLEVKSGQNEVPSWLPLPAEWEGSKSRFAVAALYGLSNMWAPSYNPVAGPVKLHARIAKL